MKKKSIKIDCSGRNVFETIDVSIIEKRKQESNGSKGHGSTTSEDQVTCREIKGFVIVIAMISALGGLMFGFDIGASGGTFIMDGFRVHFGWPSYDTEKVSLQQGWITSLFSLGAFFGALPSGMFADLFGRKKVLMGNCLICIAGCLVQSLAPFLWMMYVGRFISGFGIGSLSMVVTLYQSEMAPDQIRGAVVTIQQLFITLGICIAAIVNVGLTFVPWGWRISYSGNIIFAFTFLIFMFFLDESPRWLVQQERYEDARRVLLRVRQLNEIEDELCSIVDSVEAEKEGRWVNLIRSENNMRYRLTLGVLTQFFQQITGINAILFFAPTIISFYASDSYGMYGNLAIAIANFLATFITIFCIEKYGRVRLLISGSTGMCIAMFILVFITSPLLESYEINDIVGIFIMVFCGIFCVFFAFSWGPIAWVLCAEIYPQNLRGKAMSLTTATNWLMAFVIGKVTPILFRPENLSFWGTFLFFFGWCVIAFFFCLIFVPETTNIPLEKMNELFTNFSPSFHLKNKKVRGRSLEANVESSFNFSPKTKQGQPLSYDIQLSCYV